MNIQTIYIYKYIYILTVFLVSYLIFLITMILSYGNFFKAIGGSQGEPISLMTFGGGFGLFLILAEKGRGVTSPFLVDIICEQSQDDSPFLKTQKVLF